MRAKHILRIFHLLLFCPVSSIELDEEPSAGIVAILKRELVLLG